MNTETEPPARLAATLPAALLLALSLSLGSCGGPPALALVPRPVKITHDGFEVRDANFLDPDHDGDFDIVAATEGGTYYLRRETGGWINDTLGTQLRELAVMQRMHPTGEGNLDFVVERSTGLSYLAYTGIGSWEEQPERAPDQAPSAPLEVEADFDGDGRLDRARAVGRKLVVELRGTDGKLFDATEALGASALTLRGDARRLMAGDFDGDGHLDLGVVGGRLFVLFNNGGRFEHAARASAATRDDLGRGSGDDATSSPRPWFTDATQAAGIAFTHIEGDEQWDIRPTMGPGLAWADVDGDGDPDLYVVGGSGQHGRLFLNQGNGRFEDGTRGWGLGAGGNAGMGAGMGASFCDWDDDGDLDLYVTRDGPNVMWRHDGDHYTDVTEAAGTGDDRWSAGCAWADVDRDGDLDLFVTNYLLFDTDLIPTDGEAAALRREDPIAMLPYVFPGQTDVLYRNEGNGRFTDISAAAGLSQADGKGLGVISFDHDDDGWPDFYVANDTTPNVLWRNLGISAAGEPPRFEEIALFVGLDDPRGGMGLAFDDVDGDGDEDLFVTYWQLEPNGLYRNNMLHPPSARRFVPRFEDIAVKAGLAQASVGYVGWGCALADLDNDGDSDLMVANGYTSPDYETTMTCVGQPNQLFENHLADGGRLAPATSLADVPRFTTVSAAAAGLPFGRALASRGVAAADYDGDGDLDLAVSANNGPLTLLRNERGGRSLRVIPESRQAGTPREALGARVSLSFADGSRRMAVVRRGGSYLSGHERGVRFGLAGGQPRSVGIDWPDGRHSDHALEDLAVTASGTVRLVQPNGP